MQFNNSMLSKIYLVVTVSLLQFCTSPTVKDTAANTADTIININKQSNTPANTLASFTWNDELCEYKGNYNPQTYPPDLIKNTYELYSVYAGLLLENRPSVYKPSDLAKLNLKALTAEYTEKKSFLEKLKIVDAPFWNTLKKQTLQQLDEEYEFDKLKIQAFDNPEVLLNNRYSKSCERFVTALNATDTSILFATWKSFAEELKAKNGSPEAFMARFYDKYNSPEKLIYAKIDLITFGWGNCANSSTFHIVNDGSAANEFEKLFTNVKRECEEP
ncbi:hypothetical protein ABIE54_005736 [Chitinophagaceae bacterium OAS944]